MTSSSCACSSSAVGGYDSAASCDNSLSWDCGTFANGAELRLQNIIRSAPIAGFKLPNIIQFVEDPFLISGDAMIINNSEKVVVLRGIGQNVTVTGATTLVAGLYEVPTSLAMTTVTGATSISLQTVTSSVYCSPGTATSGNAITADILGAAPNLANFSGYVYGRPLNSLSISGCVFVTNGSSKVTLKDASFLIRKGDKISLDQTSLVGASSATVIDVSTGRASDGSRVTQIELNTPVTGVTAVPAAVGQLPQVTATVRPQMFAQLVFTASGAFETIVTLPRAITSNPNFPLGAKVEASGARCEGQQYCYSMVVSFPGNNLKTIYGTLILR